MTSAQVAPRVTDAGHETALAVEGLTAGYEGTMVLRGVDFSVRRGEVMALLGPNGAGKTTLLRAATGFVRARSGEVSVAGERVTGRAPHEFVRRGVCHLPEGRGIFPSLTVEENVIAQARGRRPDDALDEVTEYFPALADRRRQTAGSLSGGEQQMLALSRAFLTRPSVVLVDEASLGLSPLMVDKIYEALDILVRRGVALVLVEQYVQRALEMAHRLCILNRGVVVHRGPAAAIAADEVYDKYLGIEA